MGKVISHKESKKKKKVLETAEALFVRHGIRRVTVEEICRKAGVSKVTFYKYFSNKIDLVRHLWDRWNEEGLQKLEQIDSMDIPFKEKIDLMFEWRTRLISRMSTEFIEEVIPIEFEMKKMIQRFMKFIRKAQERGDIRPEIRPEFFVAMIDKLNELTKDEELRKGYPTFIDFQREIRDFFWFGAISRQKAANPHELEPREGPNKRR